MALFYLNKKKQLIPIAIQLHQWRGERNPVCLFCSRSRIQRRIRNLVKHLRWQAAITNLLTLTFQSIFAFPDNP